ncbi:hypothetical protein N7492_002044 [Penicillium capsulatum]|uniref:Uncharacterized protein n=1 Tax=Penicillium capsulatum TaxID=69766 RepID=A0A9W9IJC7_9EURO|nr:hypothetical protein N7492_002044 [Penicillium capsulatum]
MGPFRLCSLSDTFFIQGKWNKCDCIMAAVGITVQQPGGWALDLSKVWNDAASSNGQLLDSQKPKVNCSSGYGDAVSLEKDWIEKLSKKFCSSGKNESVLGSMDIQSQQHSNTDVTFKIEPGEGCQADCEQGFQALFTECEGINSHTVQAKGKATVKECKALYQYEVAQGTTPDCDVGRASVIPANVFQKTPVWKHFCEHEDNSKDPRSMVVDVWGNRPTMLKRDGLQARTPPVTNLEGYDGKLFELSWKPNNQGLLSRNCSDAFHDMSQSQCGRAGSQQNNMAREGSVFVGSGTYSYKVKNEMYEVPLSAKKHFPWKDDGSQFGKPKKLGKDVYKDLWIRNACGLWNEILITPKKHLRDTGSTMWESPYTYTVFWKKDCKLEKDPQQQNMQDPRGDGSVSCKDAYKAAGGSSRPPPNRFCKFPC